MHFCASVPLRAAARSSASSASRATSWRACAPTPLSPRAPRSSPSPGRMASATAARPQRRLDARRRPGRIGHRVHRRRRDHPRPRRVRGITTATALWTSAALGLAAGAAVWWAVGCRRGPDARRAHRAAAREHPAGGADGELAADDRGRVREGPRHPGVPILDAVRGSGTELDDLTITDFEGRPDGAGWRSTSASRTWASSTRSCGSMGDLPEVSRCTLRPGAPTTGTTATTPPPSRRERKFVPTVS